MTSILDHAWTCILSPSRYSKFSNKALDHGGGPLASLKYTADICTDMPPRNSGYVTENPMDNYEAPNRTS